MSEQTITIITRKETDDRSRYFDRVQNWRYGKYDVEVKEIKTQLSNFLASMQEILDGIPEKVTGYELESVDISVEINAKGTVSLLGTGGELGGTGGLTLHLINKNSPGKK